MPPVRGFGCLEMCNYGIRYQQQRVTVISRHPDGEACLRHGGEHCAGVGRPRDVPDTALEVECQQRLPIV